MGGRHRHHHVISLPKLYLRDKNGNNIASFTYTPKGAYYKDPEGFSGNFPNGLNYKNKKNFLQNAHSKWWTLDDEARKKSFSRALPFICIALLFFIILALGAAIGIPTTVITTVLQYENSDVFDDDFIPIPMIAMPVLGLSLMGLMLCAMICCFIGIISSGAGYENDATENVKKLQEWIDSEQNKKIKNLNLKWIVEKERATFSVGVRLGNSISNDNNLYLQNQLKQQQEMINQQQKIIQQQNQQQSYWQPPHQNQTMNMNNNINQIPQFVHQGETRFQQQFGNKNTYPNAPVY